MNFHCIPEILTDSYCECGTCIKEMSMRELWKNSNPSPEKFSLNGRFKLAFSTFRVPSGLSPPFNYNEDHPQAHVNLG